MDIHQHQPVRCPFSGSLELFAYLGQLNPSPHNKSDKQTMPAASVAPQHDNPLLSSHAIIPSGWGPSFANPEILGEPLEVDFQLEDDSPRMDPRYTGSCDTKPEDPECVDPDILKRMEFEERAVWLGRWFALHYAPWVSDFNLKELGGYEMNEGTLRDSVVSPLPALCWTFRRFRLPDDEWRSPMFRSPVWYYLFYTETPLTPLEFRVGLRRFRSDIVSTLRAYAINIFGISDIRIIDDRRSSTQVAALIKDDAFLYAQGNARRMDRYLRSECILKGSPQDYPVQPTLNYSVGTLCCSDRSRCTQKPR